MTQPVELTEEDEAHLAALLAGGRVDDGYLCRRTLADGREIALTQMLYTTKLVVGDEITPKIDHIYADGWCYQDPLKARLAYEEWDGQGEPTGWTRHPGTGRRREDGDPDKEETYL